MLICEHVDVVTTILDYLYYFGTICMLAPEKSMYNEIFACRKFKKYVNIICYIICIMLFYYNFILSQFYFTYKYQ